MRIIIANYRYFIAGGPEKYMFKFMDMFLFYKMDRMYFSIMYYNWCLNRNMGFIWCKKI